MLKPNSILWRTILFLFVVLMIAVIWLSVFPVVKYQDLLDLGKTAVGVPFSSSFQITNFGFRTVTIIRVERSCHCTEAKLAGVKIGPFETIRVPLSVTTGRSSGLIREHLLFQTDAIGAEMEKISLNGIVERSVNIEMETFDQGLIEFKDREVPILVPIQPDPSAKIFGDIQYDVVFAETPVKATIQYRKDRAFLSIDVSKLPIGNFSKRMTVSGTKPDGIQLFQIQCFVSGIMLGKWKSTPAAVYFLDPDENEDVELTIKGSDIDGNAEIYAKISPESMSKDIKVDLSHFPVVRVQRSMPGSESASYGTLIIGRSGIVEDVVKIPVMMSSGKSSVSAAR